MKTRQIAYYLRNSTDVQDYQYQLENLDKKFNQNRDVNKLIYAEKVSGFKSEKERPLMNQLLKAVDNGLIDEIWVNDVTRLSRDAINMQIIVKHCQDKGVNIYFDEQNLNTLDNQGNADFTTTLLINILGQFAEANVKNFKSKGKQGKITKSKQGRYVGGLLPLGYQVKENSKEKEIIVNYKEAEIVKYIFNSYVNDSKALLQIANDLNNLKETDSNFNNKFVTHNLAVNSTWRGSTIRHILKCKWYALGIGFFGGEEFDIKDELKFIDIDLYNKAQEKLTLNINNKKPHKHTYILNNLMYCDCGARMYSKTNGEKQTYICGTTIKRESDKNFQCNVGKQIQIEKVENAVWLLVKNKLDDFKIEIENKSNKTSEINTSIEKASQLINSINTITIQNLKKQRQRTIDTFNKFGGDSNQLDDDIKAVDNKIKQENKNVDKLKSEIKMLEMSIKNLDIAEEIKKNIETIESDKNLIRYYLEKLINKVVTIGCKGTNTNIQKIIWNNDVNNNKNTYLIFNSRLNNNPLYYFIGSTENTNIEWIKETKKFQITDLNNNEVINLSIEETIKVLNCHYWEFADLVYPEKMLSDFPLIREHKDLTTEEQFNVPLKAESFGIDLNELDYEQHINYPEYERLHKAINSEQINYKFNINAGVSILEIVTPFI